MNSTVKKTSVIAISFLLVVIGCVPQAKVPDSATLSAAPAPVVAEKTTPVVTPATQVAETAKPTEVSPSAVAAVPATTEGGPVITFEETSHDFGSVGPGSKNTYSYKFKNTGDVTLKITEVKSTCNCTVPALEKKEYAPGESGEIAATYTAIASRMPVTKHLYVVSNDKKKPEVELVLTALSVPKVRIQPESFQLTLHEANAGMPDIMLTSMDGKPFAVKSFSSLGGAIMAPSDVNAVAVQIGLKAQVDIEKLRANPNGVITIELTHPDCSSVEARYVAKADYETQPAVFYLPAAIPDQAEQKELWVISNYDTDFEIETVTSEKGSIKLAKQEKQGNKYRLTVDITVPAAATSTKFFLDNLIIKIKNGPTLKVRCNAWLKPAAPAGAAAPKQGK
jgi:hypothetical protein